VNRYTQLRCKPLGADKAECHRGLLAVAKLQRASGSTQPSRTQHGSAVQQAKRQHRFSRRLTSLASRSARGMTPHASGYSGSGPPQKRRTAPPGQANSMAPRGWHSLASYRRVCPLCLHGSLLNRDLVQ
jgi:hypothetical protein